MSDPAYADDAPYNLSAKGASKRRASIQGAAKHMIKDAALWLPAPPFMALTRALRVVPRLELKAPALINKLCSCFHTSRGTARQPKHALPPMTTPFPKGMRSESPCVNAESNARKTPREGTT